MRAILLAATLAFPLLTPCPGKAQTRSDSDASASSTAAAGHVPAASPRQAPPPSKGRRGRPDPSLPDIAEDLAVLRHGEAIVHGATTPTQAPTTNSAYTGGPGLRGDIMKSGPTGPQ